MVQFPAHAGRISELMGTDKEFAGICHDYAEIVREVARKEHSIGQSGAVLVDLLRLRSDLESDIAERLSDAGEDSAALDERVRSNLVARGEEP